YRDEDAWRAAVAGRGADELVYWVDDHRYQEGPGALIVGTSTLLPGRIGDEFAVTRGHLHAIPDRAELYHCLSGRGVMLLETVDGQSEAIELTPGRAVNVPGHWIHRSVNVGDEPFVTLFCYAADAGQDYELIADAGGPCHAVEARREDGTLAQGDIAHIDIPVGDMARATQFYSTLFGWQIAEIPGFEGYPMWRAPNGVSGGGLAPRDEGFTQPR